MNIKIPQDVQSILQILEAAGFEAYVVGGCVRDSILGAEPHDWDICTNATPQQSSQCFTNNGLKVIETGIKHGTITAIFDNEQYEVTTYRVDGEYLDNRRPSEVEFVTSLREDLARRDFTINAMAYSPSAGLVDCFNGCEDLQNGVVKCVGNADDRFEEDALRIMRALRFASVFDFSIEAGTASSIVRKKSLLKNISAERLNVELCKLLTGRGAEAILNLYPEVFGVFIPEILPMLGFEQRNPHHIYDVWQHTVKAVVSCPPNPILRLSLLFHDIGKPRCFTLDERGVGHFFGHGKISADIASAVMARLKFDNAAMAQVNELIIYHDAQLEPQSKYIKRWLNKIGEERLRQLVEVKRADVLAQSDLERQSRVSSFERVLACIDEVIRQGQCFSLKALAVNGKDLIALGVPQGVCVGIALNKLMDMVIDSEIPNEAGALLNAAKTLIPRI